MNYQQHNVDLLHSYCAERKKLDTRKHTQLVRLYVILEAKRMNIDRNHINGFLRQGRCWGWGTDCKGVQSSGEMETFYILIGMVVTQVCAYSCRSIQLKCLK